ncbi:hypothetical protein B5X24_HaOG204940 [Helicoverpa armigera]|uniref:Uncharacterized protein n=1 Tax=Helicoverpa armigera TaxID=29058 RepID=A0A2W1BR88_HELAM|nr:hypothetical protein B5X24_HaOG204940 [Helicoverpa armigera]
MICLSSKIRGNDEVFQSMKERPTKAKTKKVQIHHQTTDLHFVAQKTTTNKMFHRIEYSKTMSQKKT